MVYGKWQQTAIRFTLVLVAAFLTMLGFVFQEPFQAASRVSSPVATYSQGRLRLTVPDQALHAGAGRFTVELLDPENRALEHSEQEITTTARNGQLQSEVNTGKASGH